MDNQSGMGWLIVFLGLVLVAVGLICVFAPSVPWLGRLPGDIRIEGENYRFYFPLVTCLLLSLLLSIILWAVRWLRG
jgi:uncharacterized protein HemY